MMKIDRKRGIKYPSKIYLQVCDECGEPQSETLLRHVTKPTETFDEEEIERLAIVIYSSGEYDYGYPAYWTELPPASKDHYREIAKAVLEAIGGKG